MILLTTRHTLIISLIVHFCLLLCSMPWLLFSNKKLAQAIPGVPMQSYLYAIQQVQPKVQRLRQPPFKKEKKVLQITTQPKRVQIIQQRIIKPSPIGSLDEKSTFNEHDLFTALHAAIQAAQTYPDSALTLGRSGTAKIAFTLQASGEIKGIRLVQTSGTTSLDQAAINAVQAISPFILAKQYLKNAQQFTLDVVFEI